MSPRDTSRCSCRIHTPLDATCGLTPPPYPVPLVPDHAATVQLIDAITIGAPVVVREYLDGIRRRLDALPKPEQP